MKLQFLGHSALLIETSGKRLIVDPFLTGNPSAAVSAEELPKIDYVLVTHGHGDHIGDTVEIAKKHGSTVVATAEICTYLEGKHGIDVHPMHIGGSFRFDFGKLKLTPAFHGSSIYEEGTLVYGGMPAGFLIESEGRKVYHAGDTGLTVEMGLLEYESVDVAFLPIGGNYVMDIDDALRAASFIAPKKIVPIHYDTWPVISADIGEFESKCAEMQIDYEIMKPGDRIELQ